MDGQQGHPHPGGQANPWDWQETGPCVPRYAFGNIQNRKCKHMPRKQTFRRVNNIEYRIELPDPPAFLGERARVWYAAVGKLLVDRGVMGAIFQISLALLAQAIVEYEDAAAASAKAPPTSENTRNVTVTHPNHKRFERAESRLIFVLKEHGLTPQSLNAVKGMTVPGSTDSGDGCGIPTLKIAEEPIWKRRIAE